MIKRWRRQNRRVSRRSRRAALAWARAGRRRHALAERFDRVGKFEMVGGAFAGGLFLGLIRRSPNKESDGDRPAKPRGSRVAQGIRMANTAVIAWRLLQSPNPGIGEQ